MNRKILALICLCFVSAAILVYRYRPSEDQTLQTVTVSTSLLDADPESDSDETAIPTAQATESETDHQKPDIQGITLTTTETGTEKTETINYDLVDYPPITTKYPTTIDDVWIHIANTYTRRVAHYDRRTSNPILFTLTAIDPHVDKKMYKFYAKIVYTNGSAMCLSDGPGSWKKVHRHWRPGEVANFYKLVFQLPTNDIPEVMFISKKKDCSHLSPYISVFKDEKRKYQFTVCLHNTLFYIADGDHERLAAWIEMNRALGAEKIFIYYQDLKENDKLIKTVQKYIDRGLVEAYGWYNNFSQYVENRFGQHMLIYDCMYRNMYQSKYVVLNDLDEYIVPREVPTWSEFMEKYDRPKISHFKFFNNYWHDENELLSIDNLSDRTKGCKEFSDIPIIFKRTIRSVDCRGDGKNIIKPLLMDSMGIHDGKPLKGYKQFNSPFTVGLSHHYRVKYSIKKVKHEVIQDLIMHKYMKPVINNLTEVLCAG